MDDRRSHERIELHAPRKQAASTTALLPIMAAVFIAFIVIGLAIPVLPLHVHQGLGLGTFLVGLVAGSQFAAAILSRVWAGRDADIRGAKHAVIAGLIIAAAAGLLYVLSLSFFTTPAISVVILLLGRALLGAGESFIITGAQTWGLALLGIENTSKVLAWVGSAMFAAFALGAPLGTTIYGMYGFVAVAFATTLLPLLTLLFVAPLERRTNAVTTTRWPQQSFRFGGSDFAKHSYQSPAQCSGTLAAIIPVELLQLCGAVPSSGIRTRTPH
jgi:MFS family permease